MNSKRPGQSARLRKYSGSGGGLPIELEFNLPFTESGPEAL